jgi:hypothetical protein
MVRSCPYDDIFALCIISSLLSSFHFHPPMTTNGNLLNLPSTSHLHHRHCCHAVARVRSDRAYLPIFQPTVIFLARGVSVTNHTLALYLIIAFSLVCFLVTHLPTRVCSVVPSVPSRSLLFPWSFHVASASLLLRLRTVIDKCLQVSASPARRPLG